MAASVLILNGPNLDRLGTREPAIYGTATFADLVALCTAEALTLGLAADVRQSNDEAELIGWLHEAADSNSPVIINPAAFTHYSYSLRDACAFIYLIQRHARSFDRLRLFLGSLTGSLLDLALSRTDLPYMLLRA